MKDAHERGEAVTLDFEPDASRSRGDRLSSALALGYIGLPTLLYFAGWITPEYGWPACAVLGVCLALLVRRLGPLSARLPRVPLAIAVVVAIGWTVLGGVGHLVYANTDWLVRDAVLRDLVVKPWPVSYDPLPDTVSALLLRAPIGFYLPAAIVGKVFGLRAAELALLAWIALGVILTFVLMQRDRPTPRQLLVRLAVFVVFSGMDIIGTITHFKYRGIGDHIEWWAFLFQYSSQTTQLFWVPNHALPGWIVVAWLLGYKPGRLPIAQGIVLLALTPLWSPLTAIGIAPLLGIAVLREMRHQRFGPFLSALFDARMLVAVALCALFVYPYIVLGSETLASGSSASIPFVGEDIVPRYIEFVVLEFAGFAALLLFRFRRDPLLLGAVVVLLLLPLYRFGPANDLAMRASIPALALLAIRLGEWLSQPRDGLSDRQLRWVAIALLAIGAVTPLMEVARLFIEPRWDMDTQHDLIEVSRGWAPHYLTPIEQPWPDRFLRHP